MQRPGASSNLPETYAVLTRDGDISLIVASTFVADAAQLTGISLYPFGNAVLDFSESTESCNQEKVLLDLLTQSPGCGTPIEALVEAVTKNGLRNAQIGLEMDGMPLERTQSVIRSLPHAFLRDCSRLILLVRAVKSPQEISRLTRAAEITEKAAMQGLTTAGPGVRVMDVVQNFHANAAAMGAEFDHFAFSPRGFGLAIDSDYRLRSDDILYIDFGCKFSHYFSDTGLTLALTTLSPPLRLRYEALLACMEAGAHLMRPGAKSSQVQKAMANEFAAHGFVPSFPHGHGLGLEVRDYPILVPDTGLQISDDCVNVPSDLFLEEGMVNNLEAFIFLPCIGSLHMERSFVVTADGNRELVRQNREQPFFCTANH
jgi:Xaa-Pro aminopeptidase